MQVLADFNFVVDCQTAKFSSYNNFNYCNDTIFRYINQNENSDYLGGSAECQLNNVTGVSCSYFLKIFTEDMISLIIMQVKGAASRS